MESVGFIDFIIIYGVFVWAFDVGYYLGLTLGSYEN